MTTEIEEFRKIDSTIERYDTAIAKFQQALKIMGEAQSEVIAGGFGDHAISRSFTQLSFYGIHSVQSQLELTEKYRQCLGQSLWGVLTEKSGLASIMDAAARAEWDQKIEQDYPPCNIETLEGTFRQLHENQHLIFNRGVVNAFRSLSRK